MKISLTNRSIPRNKQGDPNFSHGVGVRLYDVFTPTEVCELVNRCLYQLEYQSRSHSKYRAERESLVKPVREMFKQLYPHESFAKATDEQIRECVERIKSQQ